jgi:aminoglycoside 6'-N-acetyltransferase
MLNNAITFIAVSEDHRNLLLHWLNQPHVKIWWGDPADAIAEIYDNAGEHQPFLACINNEPIAYIQSWKPSQNAEWPWQNGLTPTTRGIDITIGEEKNLGKGLGTQILKHFAAKLFAEGATRLVIDPDETNERAIACYIKAGFLPYDFFQTAESRDVLMDIYPSDMDYGHGYTQN